MNIHSWFTVKKVHPHVVAIAEFSHEEKVVSYLLLGKTHAYLIDTGTGHKDISRVVHAITTLPVRVLLTHSHWDHIGGVSSFSSVYLYGDAWEQQQFHSTHPHFPTIPLTDGQVLKEQDMNIHVIHTPGHTPGSVCYYVPKYKALFTGDTIYPGPLYAHLPESNVQVYAHTLQMVYKRMCRAHVCVFPGHNSMKTTASLIQEASKGFTALIHGELAVFHVIRHTKVYTSTNLSIRVSV